MSIEGVLVFYRTIEYANSWKGGGGLNCEARVQVLVVTPPSLFFLKVGRKRGGVTAGQYGTSVFKTLHDCHSHNESVKHDAVCCMSAASSIPKSAAAGCNMHN